MGRAFTFDWFGDSVNRKIKSAETRGLIKALDFIKGESVKIVPKDTGDLEKSANVKVSMDGTQGAVFYDTDYAIRQHEELNYRHAEGRTAKYLEIPFQENMVNALQIIQIEINKETK